MFSVVIPLYNKEKYIARTIRSVLEQTVQEFEIIVVDDGSTDNSVDEMKKFDDDRIRIVHQKNGGVSAARNRGIDEARYDLIVFLDADDFWEPDFLETVLKLSNEYKDCSVFAVNYSILSYDGSIRTPIVKGLPKTFQKGILENYFDIASRSDPLICSISVAIKKKALLEIGAFPEGIRAGEDLLTWARLASKYDIAYTIEPKAVFNRQDIQPGMLPRKPDPHDRVGHELRKLFDMGDLERIKGLENYIAYWHKIRLNIFLKLGMQSEAKKEFEKMSEFSIKNMKFYIYKLLIHAPRGTINLLEYLNSFRRKITRRNT